MASLVTTLISFYIEKEKLFRIKIYDFPFLVHQFNKTGFSFLLHQDE